MFAAGSEKAGDERTKETLTRDKRKEKETEQQLVGEKEEDEEEAVNLTEQQEANNSPTPAASFLPVGLYNFRDLGRTLKHNINIKDALSTANDSTKISPRTTFCQGRVFRSACLSRGNLKQRYINSRYCFRITSF